MFLIVFLIKKNNGNLRSKINRVKRSDTNFVYDRDGNYFKNYPTIGFNRVYFIKMV